MSRRVIMAAALAVVCGTVGVGPAAGQAQVDCSFPVVATDATGATVTVPAEPERVVALGPSAAQTMWAIGAREKVVGMPVDEYTAYLGDRDGVENVVGDDGRPIRETVVGLEPDLVLAPAIVSNDTVRSLREAGVRIYRFPEATSLADVYEKIERTGLLVGEFEAAARTRAEMRGTVATVREAVADEEPPRVYYALGGGWTAGEGTFVTTLIEAAGGENVAVRAGVDGYQQVSAEVVVAGDPEVVVVHEGSEVASVPGIGNSTAVLEENVVRVDPNFINQPGPRNVDALQTMAAAFHPEAVRRADLENPATPEPARCAKAPEPTATATGADGPGLTPIAGVLALAVLAVVGLLPR